MNINKSKSSDRTQQKKEILKDCELLWNERDIKYWSTNVENTAE